MILKTLYLQNFRNYSKKTFEFSSNTTLIIGPNASGKTNILEAIYLLSRGKSLRAKLEREMISYDCQVSNVKCQVSSVEDTSDKNELEILLTNGEVQGKRVAKKLYRINGVGKRTLDFVGNLKSVLFRPEDIDLVLGSPSLRRKYLDSVGDLVDRDYRVCSMAYSKGLRQRNKLLIFIREQKANRTQLEYWNRLLVKNGEIISKKREELVEFFNEKMKTLPAGKQERNNKSVEIEYDKSPITAERLAKYQQAEIALGVTLVGPHRDDLRFKIYDLRNRETGRDLSIFGSRGEQRMAVLSLKMAELAFIEKKSHQDPVLLLDDIFSELDRAHRNLVLSLFEKHQTILTATEEYLVDKRLLGKIKIIQMNLE